MKFKGLVDWRSWESFKFYWKWHMIITFLTFWIKYEHWQKISVHTGWEDKEYFDWNLSQNSCWSLYLPFQWIRCSFCDWLDFWIKYFILFTTVSHNTNTKCSDIWKFLWITLSIEIFASSEFRVFRAPEISRKLNCRENMPDL